MSIARNSHAHANIWTHTNTNEAATVVKAYCHLEWIAGTLELRSWT